MKDSPCSADTVMKMEKAGKVSIFLDFTFY